mmetsp:Transcript_89587/g.214125  ORF Transcript_89587/g.214125 Transcript_89587/m.214125 type:complete len:214 (+) Transcript_89587:1262-1903(+)
MRLGDDLVLRFVNQEPRPLRSAIAWGKGDGGIVDGDLALDGHAAVHVDELQAAVEHHQVLRLQVEVHQALGVQARHHQDDGSGAGLDGLPRERLVLLTLEGKVVLEAVLGHFCDHVHHPVVRIRRRLALLILGVVHKHHEELRGRGLGQVRVPQGLVLRGHEGLLQHLQNLNLALKLLQAHFLRAIHCFGRHLVNLDRHFLSRLQVYALAANG